MFVPTILIEKNCLSTFSSKTLICNYVNNVQYVCILKHLVKNLNYNIIVKYISIIRYYYFKIKKHIELGQYNFKLYSKSGQNSLDRNVDPKDRNTKYNVHIFLFFIYIMNSDSARLRCQDI